MYSAWPPTLLDDYVAAAALAGGTLSADTRLPIRIAATALHGVGNATLLAALAAAGFTDVHSVAEQAEPDGDFPTVSFPNPEEPGATDRLLALASSVGADLAVANDPDADRIALGVPFDTCWRMLSGDETGALLGDFVLSRLDRRGRPDPLVASTVVSSRLLCRIAAAHGSRFGETLTGFKWIVRAGDGRGTGLVYGYEEALGVCVDPEVVRDKDGISAAVAAAKMVESLAAAGSNVPTALDDLARRFGLHLTDQLAFRVDDPGVITEAMAAVRGTPPEAVGGEPVVEYLDLLPATDAILLLAERWRVVIRPSGTEPKLKCYLELVLPVPSDASAAELQTLRTTGRAELDRIRAAVRQLLAIG